MCLDIWLCNFRGRGRPRQSEMELPGSCREGGVHEPLLPDSGIGRHTPASKPGLKELWNAQRPLPHILGMHVLYARAGRA